MAQESSEDSDDEDEEEDLGKAKKGRSKAQDNMSDSESDDSTNASKSDDSSVSSSSRRSKQDDVDKSSTNADTSDEEGKAALERINNDSSDSVTPPPPKLTPVRKRGRPPGSLNKPKNLALPHLHNVLKQRGKSVGRPRGVGRGRALKRGVGRGMMGTRGTSKASNLLKNVGRGITRSPAKRLTSRGRGGMRGRGPRNPILNKIKIKGRPGRPKKISTSGQSSESNTQKSSSSPTKDIKSMKYFSHIKSDKSSSEMGHDKWDTLGPLQGVSILEHEPDSMDEDFHDDDEFFNNGESDNVFERPVDLRSYWIPPSNVKSLMDKVCITDVTTDSGTITFRECPSNSGFFKTENGDIS